MSVASETLDLVAPEPPTLPADWAAVVPLLHSGGLTPDEFARLAAGARPELAARLDAGGRAGGQESRRGPGTSASDSDRPCVALPSLDPPPLPDSIDVLSYDIAILEVDEIARTIRAETTVRLRAVRPLAAVDLDFVGPMTIHALRLDEGGRTHDLRATVSPYDLGFDGPVLSLPLPRRVAVGEELTVTVGYEGAGGCDYGFRGVVFSARGVHTFSEPAAFRHWAPAHDVPWDKASVRISIVVPEGRAASATGILESDRVVDGRRVMTWVMHDPVAPYLIAFYLGDFVVLEDVSGRGVPLEHFTYPDLVEETAYDFANTGAILDFFARIVPYPFPRYGQTVAVFGGGMEHQTNSLIGETAIRGDRSYEWLLAHEAAHQWWGDLVTPRTWRDIWLNEGFATYFDLRFTEAAYGVEAFRARIDNLENVIFFGDSLFIDRGLPVDVVLGVPPDRIFSYVVYNKGALVLHMLRAEFRADAAGSSAGDSPLLTDAQLAQVGLRGDARYEGMFRAYAQRHAYGTASTADFRYAAEFALGRDLAWFFRQWLHFPGSPRFRWDYAAEAFGEESTVTVLLEQSQDEPHAYEALVPLRFVTDAGAFTQSVRVRERRHVHRAAVPGRVLRVEFDPENWLHERHERLSMLPLAPRLSLGVVDNPASGGARFHLATGADAAEEAEVALFDVRGRRVAAAPVLLTPDAPREWTWDGRDATGRRSGAGIYFARLSVGDRAVSRRLVFVP